MKKRIDPTVFERIKHYIIAARKSGYTIYAIHNYIRGQFHVCIPDSTIHSICIEADAVKEREKEQKEETSEKHIKENSMKVTFEYDVDFVGLPLSPPTIVNCQKCAFYAKGFGDCMRSDTRVCDNGLNGYFIQNAVREVPYDSTGETG
jgi:hypothetical protein